jgi:hypothetical protein
MGTVTFETPQGDRQFEIAGEQPTDVEVQAIQSVLSGVPQQPDAPPDPMTTPWEDVVSYHREKTGEILGPKFTPTHEGELEDLGAQFDYAKADNSAGRADWITRRYGPGTFGQDERGYFYLNLDEIDPELRERDNLPESGTIYVNRPGGSFLGLLDFSDVVGFGGAYQGPLVATTAAAFAATGVGLPMAALIMGVAAAGGKAYDEFIEEEFRGIQDQTNPEIWGDVATEFLFGAGGELVAGLAVRGITRLVKGGGTPKAERIDQLIAQGVPKSLAKTIARQQSRSEIRGDIRAGARPSIYEATGKPIAARLQAVHEGIFGNRAAASRNRRYISDLWAAFFKGNLTEAQLKDAMQNNADEVTRMIQNSMKDPEEAVRLADAHLRQTIEGELDILLNAFSSGSKQSKDWQKAMGQTVRLWQQDSSVLYRNAEDLLDTVRFSRKEIQRKVNGILASPEARMGEMTDAPLLNYIKNKETDFTLSELNALRHILGAQGKHPDLVGTAADFQIKSLRDSIDEMFQQKATQLSKSIAQGQPVAGGGFSARGPRGRFESVNSTEIMNKQREGLEKLIEANKHYTEGAEVFKAGAANMINRNIQDGYFEDLIDVAETVVRNNRPELLKAHLARVTPSSRTMGQIQQVGAEIWSSAARSARSGDIDGLNRILVANNIPEDLVLRPQQWMKDLPVGDAYRQRILDQLADTLDQYADDAVARVGASERRNINRDMLAKAWMDNAAGEARKGRVFSPGQFAQKFDDLEKETQNLLFGSEQASQLRKTLGDFYLIDNQKGEWGQVVLNDIANPNIRTIVSSLQRDLQIASEQSRDALFKAIRSGNIQNADELMDAAIKNPRLIKALKDRVGEKAFDTPGGLKDQAMVRIMTEAFPEGITAEAVQSGAFGPSMSGTIKKMNAKGSLDEILGKDVVGGLMDVSKAATRIGDASLKGKGGLAAAAYAAAFGISLILNPIGTLGGAAAILLSARLMRNRRFLMWMTKPTIRARDAKRGLNIIADEIQAMGRQEGREISRSQAMAQARNQFGIGVDGELSVSSLRIREALRREARSAGLFIPAAGGVDQETRERVGTAVAPIREIVAGQLGAAVTPAAGPESLVGQESLREAAKRGAGLDPATILGVG